MTGGLGLLGKAVVKRLCSCGYHVVVIDNSKSDIDNQQNVSYITFDLNKIEDYPSLIDKIKSLSDNVYALVNNAAYNPKIENGTEFGSLENLTVADWNKELLLNLTSPVFLVKELLPIFNRKENDHCKILNVVSTYGIVPPNQSIYENISNKKGLKILKPLGYPVTKAALVMVTKYLATYPGCFGININAIAPGGIENRQDQLFVDDYNKHVPLGRMARPEDLIGTFEFLLSSESNYIHGQVIAVDGGWTTW